MNSNVPDNNRANTEASTIQKTPNDTKQESRQQTSKEFRINDQQPPLSYCYPQQFNFQHSVTPQPYYPYGYWNPALPPPVLYYPQNTINQVDIMRMVPMQSAVLIQNKQLQHIQNPSWSSYAQFYDSINAPQQLNTFQIDNAQVAHLNPPYQHQPHFYSPNGLVYFRDGTAPKTYMHNNSSYQIDRIEQATIQSIPPQDVHNKNFRRQTIIRIKKFRRSQNPGQQQYNVQQAPPLWVPSSKSLPSQDKNAEDQRIQHFRLENERDLQASMMKDHHNENSNALIPSHHQIFSEKNIAPSPATSLQSNVRQNQLPQGAALLKYIRSQPTFKEIFQVKTCKYSRDPNVGSPNFQKQDTKTQYQQDIFQQQKYESDPSAEKYHHLRSKQIFATPGQTAHLDIDLIPLQIAMRQTFESSNMNDVVAELISKPTVFESEHFFSEKDVTMTEENYDESIKVQKAHNFSPFRACDHGCPQREKQVRGRRFRKNKDQLMFLVNEFRKNPNWTRKRCVGIAKTINLSLHQVYKWMWDQKKRFEETLAEHVQD